MAVSKESVSRSTDRILVMEIIDGKAPKSSTGNVDTRIFTGENRLHAVRDPETCFWYFKYDKGGVPEALKCKFTSFKDLRKLAETYFKSRNIKITEVID